MAQLKYEDDQCAVYPETRSLRICLGTGSDRSNENETFEDLFAPDPVPLKFKDEDWPLAWAAVSDEKIVGVIITNHDWVDDLWYFGSNAEECRKQITGKVQTPAFRPQVPHFSMIWEWRFMSAQCLPRK